MLYNVTKIYVLDNQVLYIDEGEISRNSANYNKIDVITPATGYGIGIAFELPNGVYTDEFALTQETGDVSLPYVNALEPYEGEQWSSYTMLIPNAVLSAITSTTSQTLGFSLRFTKGVTNVEVYEDFESFPSVGLGDKVYYDEEEDDYYIWDGEDYEEKTSSEADELTVAFEQAYSTERAFLSMQGTVGGEPVALDASFFQNQIVSKYNELVSLYNQLKSSVGDPTIGLAQKVTKSGDTMTGTLTFSSANATRLVLSNNDITMDNDATINATSFSNGDYVSDAVKFSDLTSLFDLGSITPGAGESFLDAYSDALDAKFDEFIKKALVGQEFLRTDGGSVMTGNIDMGGQEITNVSDVDGVDVSTLAGTVSSNTSNISGKVDKTTTIAGLDLQDNILLTELKEAIGNATESLDGLLSSEDKTTINTLTDLLKDDDQDSIVNTIQEILNVFSTYPEGADILTALNGKVDKIAGKGLSEEDFTTVLKDKLDGIESSAEVNVQADWNESDTNSDAHILNKPNVYNQTEINNLLDDKADDADLTTHVNDTNNPHSVTASQAGAEPAFAKNTAFNKDFGTTADTVAEGNHVVDTDNPHSVTAAQTGAYTTGEADTNFAAASHNHVEADITDLDKYTQTEVNNLLGDKADLVAGKIPVNQIPFQFDDVLQGYYDDGNTDLFYEEDTFDTVITASEGKLYVDISTNDIYRYDGSVYVLVKEAVGALGDIPNVTLASEASGELLRYNGSVWVNDLLPIEDLKNVVITNVADGEYLKYNNATSKWVNTELDAPVIDSLDAIDDVNASTPSSGDILQYNESTSNWEKNRINFVSDTAPNNPYVGDFWFDSSTLVLYVYYDDGDSIQWVNAVSGIVEGQPEELNDLTDVTLSTPTNGQVLTYNTSTQVFENQDLPAETGLANVDYYTTTISTGDWGGTDPSTAVKTVSGVLSTDKPLIDIDLSSVAFANVEDTQTEYAKLYRVETTANDEITFYALEAPTENLTIQIKVVR